jgi:Asp/Glu/hydantoin racemase
MARLGLLHTVPALAVTFDDLLKRTGHGAEIVHVVDAGLLAAAVDRGVDEDVRDEVLRHVRHLADDGADAILVTCSSIGEAVEEAARKVDVPVLRVDATMAEEAVALAADRAEGDRPGRIAVLATLAATLGPTGRLLESRVAGTPVEVTARVVEGAAAARSGGDQAGHDRLVAQAIEDAAASADVVVLAQASMATAAAGLELAVPVLTSPEGGAAALVAAVTRLPS